MIGYIKAIMLINYNHFYKLSIRINYYNFSLINAQFFYYIWLQTYTKHGSFFVKLIQQFVPFRIIYPCAENQAYPPIYDLPPSRESRIDFYWFNHLSGSILTFKVCI